ncbi:pectin lyase fold/virulence factor [Mycena maculata]|uniref:Pectin lyase fold/virulence factor n=1 Tax=Mycena maculata TaxID=230809 RepID=A0AAD7HRZ5_9AGAR|nr:pectin lyase fold/virulence factor [Mycena maculata]
MTAPTLAQIITVIGAIVVRQGTTTPREFATVTLALDSLPNDNGTRSIFIFQGTYAEQILLMVIDTRHYRRVLHDYIGYTTDTTTYTGNQAIITACVPLSIAGSDDACGTLRIHKDDFDMYNDNVKNTFGPASQAIEISQYGSRVGLYACGFFGYQDTGAVDFIFGREGLVHFSVKGPGCIIASGRESNDTGNSSDAVSGTSGNIYLGRPWGDLEDIFFQSNTTGTGANGASRPSFATVLTAAERASYSISSAVGSDYASWVDALYII